VIRTGWSRPWLWPRRGLLTWAVHRFVP